MKELPIHRNMAIPGGVIIACPRNDFKFVRGQQCEACSKYLGCVEVALEGDFDKRYRILCASPIARSVSMFNG